MPRGMMGVAVVSMLGSLRNKLKNQNLSSLQATEELEDIVDLLWRGSRLHDFGVQIVANKHNLSTGLTWSCGRLTALSRGLALCEKAG